MTQTGDRMCDLVAKHLAHDNTSQLSYCKTPLISSLSNTSTGASVFTQVSLGTALSRLLRMSVRLIAALVLFSHSQHFTALMVIG